MLKKAQQILRNTIKAADNQELGLISSLASRSVKSLLQGVSEDQKQEVLQSGNPNYISYNKLQSLARRLLSQWWLVIGQAYSLGYVQPIGSLVGFAGVNVHQVLTVLALHSAAPLEFTLALGDPFDSHGVVAPPTAHDLTAVCASRGLVAHSTCCAQRPCKKMHILF